MVIGESAAGWDAAPPALNVHQFDSFDGSAVVHGVTTRTPGLPLYGNVSYMVGDDHDAVRYNRQEWARTIGFEHSRLVLGRQVHETTVAVVDENHVGCGADSVETSIRRVDGLITATPNLPIGVVAADCVPVLIHDPVAAVVGAIHAGWRGTADGIVTEAVRRLQTEFGCDPQDLNVALGPSICQSCYQVGDEVVERWRENPSYASVDAVAERESGPYFDLRAANVAQLADAGVPADNIEVSQFCTRCSDGELFSRRGLGPRTGLFAAIIMLRGSVEETVQSQR